MEFTAEEFEKVSFVKKISEALVPVQANVDNVEYRIFYDKRYGYRQEYVIINYKGGARTVRSCNGDSCSAIFEEIAKYLEHGYYDEEWDLVDIESHPEIWEEVK